jgi:hypothetical protein
MTCNCNPNFHKTLTLTQTATNLVATVSNGTNISSLDYFELVLCQNPSSVITGEPLPYQVNVNGANVSLLNKYALPIYSDRLRVRKRYYGSYVVPATGKPYVILWNTPDCPAYATSQPVTTTANEGD